MDTKFSVALHVLAMINEESEALSSQAIANSVGTNASFIRRVIGLLKNAGLLESQQGKSGYRLSRSPKEISLFDIYCATQEKDEITLFHVHQNPNPECPVGAHIENAVHPLFHAAENQLEQAFKNQSLDDVIEGLYKSAGVDRPQVKS
ncbi:MAG: Rrf2 family transcriptional regulator [Corynebacterium sp.]|nr:Rrf2 family transcriptional regulator [Corynebacterium sp.]